MDTKSQTTVFLWYSHQLSFAVMGAYLGFYGPGWCWFVFHSKTSISAPLVHQACLQLPFWAHLLPLPQALTLLTAYRLPQKAKSWKCASPAEPSHKNYKKNRNLKMCKPGGCPSWKLVKKQSPEHMPARRSHRWKLTSKTNINYIYIYYIYIFKLAVRGQLKLLNFNYRLP